LGGERTVARKPTDTAHLNLRYPEGLRRRLERAGKSKGRSLNSEIVHRLEQSFRREDFQERQDAITEAMMEIIRVIAELAKHIPPVPKGRSLLDLAQYLPKDQTATQEPASPTDKGENSK
jgi:Arc-like DNA binding domain